VAERPFVAAPRQQTSLEILTLRWNHPVYVSPEEQVEHSGSRGRTVRRALPREQAFAELAADDPRPLLVLRECGWCEGTDDALLNERLDNERTVLMSHYFHAIKLPNDVLEEDHPFRELFPQEDAPHVFLATRDGEHVIGLDGQQSPVELWNAMEETLEEAGVRSPERRLEKVTRVLDQFDRVDLALQRLRVEFDVLIEEHGPRSGKVRKVGRELEDVREERDDLVADLADLLGEDVVEELAL